MGRILPGLRNKKKKQDAKTSLKEFYLSNGQSLTSMLLSIRKYLRHAIFTEGVVFPLFLGPKYRAREISTDGQGLRSDNKQVSMD